MLWLLLVVALLLIYYFTREPEPENLPPGPKPWPIVGCLPDMHFPKIFEDFDRWKKEYGDIVMIRFLQRRVILLNSYDILKEAYIHHGDNFSSRPNTEAFFIFTDGSPQGYLHTWGPLWKEQRRHALHVLRDFGLGRSFQEEKIEIEIVDLLQEFDRLLACSNGTIDPMLPIKYAVVNIINSILFGFRFEYDDERFAKLQDMIVENTNELAKVLILDFVPGIHYLKVFLPYFFPHISRNLRKMRDFFRDEIERHKKTYSQDLEINNGKSSDFTYAYIAEMNKRASDPNNSFTENQLFWCLLDLFAAGFETTATTLRWFVAYMAHYPLVQEKLFQELRRNGEGTPSYGDRARYPYANAVIAELQRHINLTPSGVPHCNFEDDTIGGYFIPKGSFVVTNLYSILNDPKLFSEPKQFDPDRFMVPSASGDTSSTEHVIPFLIGKRSCLGEGLAKMELFMFATAIVWAYEIEMPDFGDRPDLEDGLISFVRAPKAFHVKMTRRD